MDYQTLKSLIVTNDLENLTDSEIVTALNTPTGTRHEALDINSRALMAKLGAFPAAIILKKLSVAANTNVVLEFIMSFMGGIGVNFGDPETLAGFDLLSTPDGGSVITPAERDLLKGLTLVPSSLALTAFGVAVNVDQVSIAQRGI